MPNTIDVVFDSRNFDAGSLDTPTFNMKPALSNIVGFTPLWVNIPFSFYTIDSLNNSFNLTINLTQVTVILRPGTYNTSSLADEIQSQIRTAVANNGAISGYASNQFCVYVQPQARFIVYTKTGLGDGTSGTIDGYSWNMTNDSLAQILGFGGTGEFVTGTQSDFYFNGANAGATMFLSPPFQANLLPSALINVHSTLAGYGQRTIYPDDAGDILTAVPITGNFLSNLYYSWLPVASRVSRYSLSQVTFYLTLNNRFLYALEGGSFQASVNYQTVSYLPLNGQAFQICIRFYLDDAQSSIYS